ncbi:MAG: alpha/beta hydrolase [Chloroflexota bacterium]
MMQNQPQTRVQQKNIGHFRSPASAQAFYQAYDEAMRDLPEPTCTYDLPTSFGVARMYKFGDGEATPFVLLPGRAASTPMWETNLVTLMQHRAVYTVDLIGEPGMSVQTRPFTNNKDQAVWLQEALDGIPLQSFHLVGVSIGGWNAVNLFIHAPQHIASLTLLDPASVFGRFTWKVIVVSLGSVLPFMPQVIRMKLLSWISGGAETDESIPTAKLIAAGMRDYSNSIPAPTYPSDEQLQSINIPILSLIAGKSIIHNPKQAEARAKKLLKKGQVELWHEASHAINGECADQVNQAILRFVDHIEADINDTLPP